MSDPERSSNAMSIEELERYRDQLRELLERSEAAIARAQKLTENARGELDEDERERDKPTSTPAE